MISYELNVIKWSHNSHDLISCNLTIPKYLIIILKLYGHIYAIMI
jgi:hypothetical protein